MVAAVLAGLAAEDEPARSAPGPDGRRAPVTSSVGGPPSGPVQTAEVAIGADHGGYALKERIVADLRERGFAVHDCGTHSTDSVDYPDFAHAVARLVADGACRVGIVVDGAGIGSAWPPTRCPGVRAATCWDLSSARNSREHNHANVLTLGAGLIGEGLALRDRRGVARRRRGAASATPAGSTKITEIERALRWPGRPRRSYAMSTTTDAPRSRRSPARSLAALGSRRRAATCDGCGDVRGRCAAHCSDKVRGGRRRRRRADQLPGRRRQTSRATSRATSTTRCSSPTPPPPTSTSSATRRASIGFASVCVNPSGSAAAPSTCAGTTVRVASRGRLPVRRRRPPRSRRSRRAAPSATGPARSTW